MMKKRGHVICSVEPGSIAEEMGLEPGDRLLSVDGHDPEDIFDYEYYLENDSVIVLVEKAGGEEWELDIENNYQDLGLTFENGLMSEYRSCTNRCIFCFVDQMPPGMRETLYFKDDDSRLSFLQGNYITLTNMKKKDIDRIIRFKLSPINISIHTTNPALRCRMLRNRFAGESLRALDRLFRAGTPMNGQIVLCKGINDGEELERTIGDLSRYIPCMESVSVVPVGLTRYRQGLYPLEPFTAEDAVRVIDRIERWQRKLFAEHGTHFVHASDEFYILAGRPLPEAERYDGYPQLENGVGMVRLMTEEVQEALAGMDEDEGADGDEDAGSFLGADGDKGAGKVSGSDYDEAGRRSGRFGRDTGPEELSVATGQLAAGYIQGFLDEITAKYPNRNVHLYPITNEFFGEMITVSGLITGRDLIRQLKGKPLGSRLLLPASMFRSGEDVFLDDVTKEDVENALQVPVNIVKSSGRDFVEAVLYPPEEGGRAEHAAYELPRPAGINAGSRAE